MLSSCVFLSFFLFCCCFVALKASVLLWSVTLHDAWYIFGAMTAANAFTCFVIRFVIH